jgi:hypothetical protein
MSTPCKIFFDQLLLEQTEVQTLLQNAIDKKEISKLTKKLKNIQNLINDIYQYNAINTTVASTAV